MDNIEGTGQGWGYVSNNYLLCWLDILELKWLMVFSKKSTRDTLVITFYMQNAYRWVHWLLCRRYWMNTGYLGGWLWSSWDEYKYVQSWGHTRSRQCMHHQFIRVAGFGLWEKIRALRSNSRTYLFFPILLQDILYYSIVLKPVS